tara:strand:+ start:641 stop:955 length:315 start_codon:yes stop_codon:yes gene_type:complete
MSAEITKILLENMPELIKDDKIEPTDLILDMVWRQLRKTQPDLLEVAIEDEIEKFDILIYSLADRAWVSTAATLQLFIIRKLRAVAYETIMGYESSILNADHCS